MRTTLVDTEWDSTDGVLGQSRGNTSAGNEHSGSPPELEDEELQTVSIRADRLRELASLGSGDKDENTEVMSAPHRARLRADSNEVDVDQLLASEEERYLPPAPGSPRPEARLPPPPKSRHPRPSRRSLHPPLPTPSASPLPAFDRPGVAIPAPSTPPATNRPPPPPSLPRSEFPPEPPAPLLSQPSPSLLAQPAPSLLSQPSPSQQLRQEDAAAPPLSPVTDKTAPPFGRPSSSRRLWIILGIALPLAATLGIGIGSLLFAKEEAAPAPAPSSVLPARPVPQERPQPQSEEAAPQSLLERAAAGESNAIEELEAKSPATRTSAETIALSEGHSQRKALALQGFAAEIEKDAKLLDQKDQLERLKEFYYDRETTNLAAHIIANLPGHLAPDLFYELWTGTKRRDESTILAQDLVQNPDMRDKASPALRLALELRDVEDCDSGDPCNPADQCETAKALLPRAIEEGDQRSTHLLGRLIRTTGCGPKKRDDCWKCLRDLEKEKGAPSLVDAIRATRERDAPKL